MKQLFVALSLVLALTGCASPVFLVNPRTGQTVRCASATAWSGLGGAVATGIGANVTVQRCVEQMEALGYVRADNLPEAKKQLADKGQKDVLSFQEAAKKQLGLARSLYPDRPQFRIDALGWADGTVVRLGPNAAKAGVRLGDRIVAVNGERHNDRQGLLGAIVKNRPDEQILLTLLRDGVEIERKVDCMDGRPVADKGITMLEAASQGRWRDCVTLSYELERPPLNPSYSVALIRHACNDAERFAANRRPTGSDARLLYETRRRQIEEANYVPEGIARVRGEVLGSISWLEQNGFRNFSADLRELLEKASSPERLQAQPKSEQVSNGTCFAVSPDGAILTSRHVVSNADSVKIHLMDGRSVAAIVEQAVAGTDLALLRIAEPTPTYLSLAPSRSPQVGQSVFTLGFPATSILGTEPKFSDGSISALSGVRGEASLMQISVPIQPGNSGGPLVNDQGQVVGVITASAAILPFVAATGSLPQNVNWAVKADYARPLFPPPVELSQARSRQDAIEQARRALCRVEAVRR